MANFDGVQLPLDHSSGAVLLLTRRPDVDWMETLPDGIKVRLSAQSYGIVIANLSSQLPLDELPSQARDAANRALDLIAMRSGGSYQLADATGPHLCWGTSSAGIVMRLLVEVRSTFLMTVGGGPTAYSLTWHESMRYFRMSQTTTDLFDAFRNLYLALESLLSHIAPVRKKRNGKYESEGEWTRRALSEADSVLRRHNSGMTIGRYLISPSKDEVTTVFNELYVSIRTSIFHAKNGRPFVVPQDQKSRVQIADALARYAMLYTDLAEVMLGARFLRSGLSPAGFARMVDTCLPYWVVSISDRNFSRIEDFNSEAAAALVTLSTSRAPTHDGPFRAAVLGVARTADLMAVPVIQSVAARNTNGDPVMVESLVGELSIDGVDQLECRLTFQIQNSGAKSRYET